MKEMKLHAKAVIVKKSLQKLLRSVLNGLNLLKIH